MSTKHKERAAAVREHLHHTHGMYVDCKPCYPYQALNALLAEVEEAERIFRVLSRTGPLIPIQEAAAIAAWLK